MNLWDKKAKTYAKYNPKLNLIQEQSFKEFANLKIEFKDKILLDIACGTGVWSLHLARKVKKLIGVDSSKAMLEFLEQDAKKFKITNVQTYHLSFEDFLLQNPNFSCDIVFLSMAAVLNSKKDYEAFMNLAPLRIYLGWQEFRQSDFLEPIFKHFDIKNKTKHEEDIESFLVQNHLSFSRFVFDETRKLTRSKEEALENASWHLQMSGFNPPKKELEKLISTSVNETISSKIKLLVF